MTTVPPQTTLAMVEVVGPSDAPPITGDPAPDSRHDRHQVHGAAQAPGLIITSPVTIGSDRLPRDPTGAPWVAPKSYGRPRLFTYTALSRVCLHFGFTWPPPSARPRSVDLTEGMSATSW